MKWSAAQTLSWIIKQEPLELKDWPAGMGPQIEPAQKMLSSRINASNIRAEEARTARLSKYQAETFVFRGCN
jgi:hypothetical protein